jgi:hypothetical protein
MAKLEKILSTFTKTIAQLDKLVEANQASAKAKSDRAATLVDESKVLVNEAVKAGNVKINIEKLLAG